MTFKEEVQVVVSDSDNFIYPKKGHSLLSPFTQLNRLKNSDNTVMSKSKDQRT